MVLWLLVFLPKHLKRNSEAIHLCPYSGIPHLGRRQLFWRHKMKMGCFFLSKLLYALSEQAHCGDGTKTGYRAICCLSLLLYVADSQESATYLWISLSDCSAYYVSLLSLSLNSLYSFIIEYNFFCKLTSFTEPDIIFHMIQ